MVESRDRRGPKRRKYQYHTHGVWGCIYSSQRDMEAVIMVNESGQQGLTRRIANRMNAGTL